MGNYNRLAERFTDQEYLSKDEILNIVGGNIIDLVWSEALSYRESFMIPTLFKKSDDIPLKVCICPSIEEYLSATLDSCNDLKEKFNLLSKNPNSIFVAERKKIIISELYHICLHYNKNISLSDIEMVIDSSKSTSNEISLISKAFKYVKEYEGLINKEFIFNIEKILTNNPEVSYRNNKTGLVNPYKLEEYINLIVDKIVKNNDNCFINAALIHFIFLYSMPFDFYSALCGSLVSLKYLKDKGFTNSVFYVNFFKNLFKNTELFRKSIDLSIKNLDFTYYLITYIQTLIIGQDEALDVYSKIKINKAKEEFIDNEDIKINIDNVNNIEKELIEESKEETKSYLDETYEKETINRSSFDYVEDPFVNDDTKQVNTTIVSKQTMAVVKKNLWPLVKDKLDLEEEELTMLLVHADPSMKKHQAYFFAKNHDSEAIYTIQNYKEYIGCSYETARYSLIALEAFNLYRSFMFKNKLVYKLNDEK